MAIKNIVQTFKGKNYPQDMRRQLWPLCCGASIISGFKSVNILTKDELVADIEACMGQVPDMQVFADEEMQPKFTFLTLNSTQMKSKKILTAIEKAGFFLIGTGKPRKITQAFYLRDDTEGTWEPTGNTKKV